MKKIFAYLVFLLLITVFILELGLRLKGTYKTYTEKIGQGYHTYYGEIRQDWYWTNAKSSNYVLDHGEFQFDYTTNSLGLREREADWNDSIEIRLAVFGDSFTEGVGAAYDSTWPRELERQLLANGFNASVINAGVSGSDPFFSFQLFRDMILPLQPTHIIFAPNRTDMEDYFFRSGFERFQEDGTTKNRKAPGFHFWYRHSHLARMYFENIKGYDKTLMLKSELKSHKLEAAAAIKACLDSTNSICADHNIKFMAASHVTPGLLCYDKQPEADARYYNDFDYAYPYIYLEDQFRAEVPTAECDKIGWKTDGHFNATGYTLMGKLLFTEIEREYPDFWQSY